MWRWKLAALIGGIALSYMGVKAWRLSGVVKSEPQVISCADLGKNGYGDNANLKLKDYMLSPGGFVYEEEKGGKWTKVWVPIVPSDGPFAQKVAALPEGADLPTPTSFHVILQSESVASEADFRNVTVGDYLPGVVINEVDSLDRETKKLLKDSYPGIDLETCWILDHGRSAPGTGGSIAKLLAGLALIGLSIWLFVRKSGKRRPT